MNKLFYTLLIVLLYSCQSTSVKIDNLNLDKWKSDKNACLGYRNQKIEELQSSKNNLLRLSEKEIINTIGKPDKEELMKRSQKSFIYYLEKNTSCSNYQENSDAIVKVFQIRFNAMGYSNELLINQEYLKD